MADILYVKGYEEYVRIVCADRTVIAYERMKNMETTLVPHGFVRVHRSYIVAVERVQSFTNRSVMVHGIEIPVSRSARAEVQRVLGGGAGF